MRHDRSPAVLLGAILATAGVVGGAWILDARHRERQSRLAHRILVELLLNSLSAGDAATARHSRRVADLGYVLARRLGMSGGERATLRVAALLHDMGKIDDRFFDIIHSHGPLTPVQRAEIKHHPHESAHILAPLETLHPGITRIVSSHHECWDGSGYPRGLRGTDIPLSARIIAVADVFDAISEPRTYRGPLPLNEVLRILREGAGKQFDPHIVRLLHEPWVRAEWQRIAHEGQADEERQLAKEEARLREETNEMEEDETSATEREESRHPPSGNEPARREAAGSTA